MYNITTTRPSACTTLQTPRPTSGIGRAHSGFSPAGKPFLCFAHSRHRTDFLVQYDAEMSQLQARFNNTNGDDQLLPGSGEMHAHT